MSTHRPEQPAPDYVPGHDLLAGKVVVVTAAAGAGIGAAVVRRALEEGAKAVVFSDTHARRLADIIPDARIEAVQGARTFLPIDRPDALAVLIRDFVRWPRATGTATAATPRGTRQTA